MVFRQRSLKVHVRLELATATAALAILCPQWRAELVAQTNYQLAIEAGDQQTGSPQTALPDPLVVKVIRPTGTPVSGVSIGFAITQQPQGAMGATLTSTFTVTSVNGTASTRLTLGDKPGQYEVTASCIGTLCSPNTVTFKATAGCHTDVTL